MPWGRPMLIPLHTDSVPASSDPTASIVLMGKSDWSEESQPIVIPELQARAVIK